LIDLSTTINNPEIKGIEKMMKNSTTLRS